MMNVLDSLLVTKVEYSLNDIKQLLSHAILHWP